MLMLEWVLVLLLAAVVLTNLAERLAVPYPSLLAIAGAGLAWASNRAHKFKTAAPDEYVTLFNQILEKLDPRKVMDDLEALGPNPTILCWERPSKIESGHEYCHRHLVAQWLEDTIGIQVQEIGFPKLKRFGYLRSNHVPPISYAPRAPENLFDFASAK